MRIAIFAASVLSIASFGQGHAQVLQAADAAALGGAVPALTLSSPNLSEPESIIQVKHVTLRHGPLLPYKVSEPRAGGSAGSVLSAPRLVTANAGLGALSVAEHPRSVTDHLLAGAVALMLIAYQLRRKHRVLRPHPFMT